MTDIAYNNAVDQYADGVYRFIVKNIHQEEDARDIVQTAFEKLWVNRDTVDPLKIKSYLFTIAYHQMIDHIRKVKKYTTTDIYETTTIDPVYQPQHELRQTILKAIHENLAIKKSALQQLTDFSASAIDKNLEALKKEGLLEREGTKGGVWIIHYIYP